MYICSEPHTSTFLRNDDKLCKLQEVQNHKLSTYVNPQLKCLTNIIHILGNIQYTVYTYLKYVVSWCTLKEFFKDWQFLHRMNNEFNEKVTWLFCFTWFFHWFTVFWMTWQFFSVAFIVNTGNPCCVTKELETWSSSLHYDLALFQLTHYITAEKDLMHCWLGRTEHNVEEKYG